MKALYPTFVLLAILFSSLAWPQLYKCENKDNAITFQDTPCENQGEAYEPPKIETTYKTITLPKSMATPKDPSSKQEKSKQDCPHFASYTLRNLRVQDRYIEGMSKQHIEKRLGRPDSSSASKWVYNSEYVRRTFYFEDNCLKNWKEKWHDKESQISKYRK
ncbi:hypothetical protein [Bermanella sp. R86510]|uniref:hypothetical protein n=1 Tax=unclassified Bermanella TaxID=2627862 RepID=UPI0037CC3D79